MKAHGWTIVGAVALFAGMTAAQAQGYAVAPIKPRGGSTFCVALNNKGEAACSAQVSSTLRSFRYSAGKIRYLGSLGGTRTIPEAINDAGQIVGYSYTSGNSSYYAFLYSKGKMINLGGLGGDRSVADGINDAGQIVGGAATASGGEHAFLYEDGAMQDLGSLGGNSLAGAINNHGQAVGQSYAGPSNSKYAVLFDGGAVQDLGVLSADDTGSQASAINDDGLIAGTSFDFADEGYSNSHAFLYSNGSMAALNIPNSIGSTALGINKSGQVAGYYYIPNDDVPRAFIYSNGIATDLTALMSASMPRNVVIFSAAAINDSGQVLVNAFNTVTSWGYSYLLTPTP